VRLSGGDRHRGQRAGARLLLAAVGRDLLPSRRAHRGRGDQRAEFYTRAPAVRIDGPAGKIDPRKLAEALAQPVYGVVHLPQPAAVSITQATEMRRRLCAGEIAAIATSTHRHGLKLHMDGARFANALSFVGCSPAELSWKAGVDVLSLGATKNGAMAREVVIFFEPSWRATSSSAQARRPSVLQDAAAVVAARRLLSPTACGSTTRAMPMPWRAGWCRADAAQGHVVALSGRSQRDLRRAAGGRCTMRLQDAGAQYHPWPSDRPGERAFRLVTAFDTESRRRRPFLAIAKSSSEPMTHQRTLTAAHLGRL
jgi:threonine aldolase